GPFALESKLEGHATLERRGITENDASPCQETIENGELPCARDRNSGWRCRLESVLQRLLERGWRFVLLAHAASPPRPRSGRRTSPSSPLPTSPRARASRAACRRRSGEILSREQSSSVREGDVAGTAPNQERSLFATSV